MTDNEKEKIKKLRLDGVGYKSIATTLGISVNTIKSYCKRYSLNGDAEVVQLNQDIAIENKSICKNCGKVLVQKEKQKPKIYCSDKCRLEWWNKNADKLNRKAYYTLTCKNCNKEFISYGNRTRKYCSSDCYFKSRFGGKENGV